MIPTDWKEANIAPIFKKGSKNDPSNYRPVSLTCVCSKLMEHVIVHHLMAHLEKYRILAPAQHGFRAKHSCVTQLISTIDRILNYHDANTQVDAIILDFSKAFDVVSHRKLLSKLDHYGIRGDIHRWIGSFLHNRNQRVVVNGKASNRALVESGVPQGTCLGPVLFLCYINDITQNISSHLRLFADDALLFRPIKSEADHHALDADLQTLSNWAKSWSMKFNAKKCHSMTFSRKPTPSSHFYTLSGEVLSQVLSSPYLGVTISNDLNFNTHIAKTTSKASRTLGFLTRTLRACPPRLRELAYFSMCRSTLEYAAVVWDPKPNSQAANSLERIQRRAARFVKGDFRRRSSVTNILQKLEWEPLNTRRQNQRLVTLHQTISDKIATDVTIKHGRRGRLLGLRCSTDKYKNSFLPRTISDFNSLNQQSREAETTEAFKASLPKGCY